MSVDLIVLFFTQAASTNRETKKVHLMKLVEGKRIQDIYEKSPEIECKREKTKRASKELNGRKRRAKVKSQRKVGPVFSIICQIIKRSSEHLQSNEHNCSVMHVQQKYGSIQKSNQTKETIFVVEKEANTLQRLGVEKVTLRLHWILCNTFCPLAIGYLHLFAVTLHFTGLMHSAIALWMLIIICYSMHTFFFSLPLSIGCREATRASKREIRCI